VFYDNITSASWKFVSSFDIWGLPTTGLHTTYGGGGYIADLGINYEISKQVINNLYKYIWIDRKTRAIFTEFTLYNVNENLFVYVSLLCEFPDTNFHEADVILYTASPLTHGPFSQPTQ
jgi:hypothetical protein